MHNKVDNEVRGESIKGFLLDLLGCLVEASFSLEISKHAGSVTVPLPRRYQHEARLCRCPNQMTDILSQETLIETCQQYWDCIAAGRHPWYCSVLFIPIPNNVYV